MAFANPHIYIPTGLSEAQELEYIEPFAKILVDDKGADLWLHPLLLSNLVDAILFGVVATQTLAWTVRFAKKDAWGIRALVPMTFIAALAPTVLHSMWAVKIFTQSHGLYAPLFEFKYEGALFGLVCPQFLPVQLYSMYRLFNLSRTRSTRTLLGGLVVALLGQIALFLSYATSIPFLATRITPRVIGTLEGGLLASAAVSVGVAVGLVDGLKKQRAAVGAMGAGGASGGRMRRALNSAVECQMVPALAALALAIGVPALRHFPTVTYLLPLSKLAPASLLLTLNSRKGLRRISLAAPAGASFLSLPDAHDANADAEEGEGEGGRISDTKGPIRLTPSVRQLGVPAVFVGGEAVGPLSSSPGTEKLARPARPAPRFSEIPSALPPRSRIEQALLFAHDSDSSAPNTPLVRQGSPSPSPGVGGHGAGLGAGADERLAFAFQRADLSSPLGRVGGEEEDENRWGRREEGYYVPPSPSVGDHERD